MATNSEIFKQLNKRINELERKNTFINSLLILFIIITVLLGSYIIYIEVEEPPFGKWSYWLQEKEQTEQYNDYLLSRIDSISRANQLLMEDSPYYSGVFFEVQIGAFQYFDLQTYQESLEKLRSYREDNLNKYVLGKFRDFRKAQAFLKDIQRIGVADAFIIAKIDGERVEIREALEVQRKEE